MMASHLNGIFRSNPITVCCSRSILTDVLDPNILYVQEFTRLIDTIHIFVHNFETFDNKLVSTRIYLFCKIVI